MLKEKEIHAKAEEIHASGHRDFRGTFARHFYDRGAKDALAAARDSRSCYCASCADSALFAGIEAGEKVKHHQPRKAMQIGAGAWVDADGHGGIRVGYATESSRSWCLSDVEVDNLLTYLGVNIQEAKKGATWT